MSRVTIYKRKTGLSREFPLIICGNGGRQRWVNHRSKKNLYIRRKIVKGRVEPSSDCVAKPFDINDAMWRSHFSDRRYFEFDGFEHGRRVYKKTFRHWDIMENGKPTRKEHIYFACFAIRIFEYIGYHFTFCSDRQPQNYPSVLREKVKLFMSNFSTDNTVTKFDFVREKVKEDVTAVSNIIPLYRSIKHEFEK